MAAPTIQLNVEGIDLTRRFKRVIYSLQLISAGTPTYTSGGETLDLTAALNAKKLGRAGLNPTPLPDVPEIELLNEVLGLSLQINKNGSSPTLKNYLARFFNGTSELGSGANYTASTFGTTAANAPKFLFAVRTRNFN